MAAPLAAALVADCGSGMCLLVLLVDAVRAVFTSLSAGPPAGGQLRGEILADMVHLIQTAENCGISAVAVHQGRRADFPCRDAEADSHGPDCCWTIEFHQFVDTVDDVPVVQTYRFSRAGPRSSFPVVTQRLVSKVLLTVEIPQLQHIDRVVDFYCAGSAVLECRRGGDSRAPTVALVDLRTGCCMPGVCNDRCRCR